MSRRIETVYVEEFRVKLIRDEKSSATIEKYLRDVKAFQSFAGDRTMSKELLIEYKTRLMAQYAPSSVNSMLAAINCFLKELGWHDCTVKAIKIQRASFRLKEKELSKAEYFRLLDAARRKNNRRLYLLMQTICSTGIRVGELNFITVEAVRAGRATVSLKGKTRQVLIPSSLLSELKDYIKEQNIASGCIFVTRSGRAMDRSNILHEMKALCSEANVDERKVFPHNLRHLFACIYYKKEKDLSRLADILGHSNINTTRIYTCVSGQEQQRQMDRLGLVLGKKEIPHNIHYAVNGPIPLGLLLE